VEEGEGEEKKEDSHMWQAAATSTAVAASGATRDAIKVGKKKGNNFSLQEKARQKERNY